MNSLFTMSDQVQSPFHSDHFHSLFPLLLTMVVRIIKKEGIWADTFNQTRRTKKLNSNRSPLKFSRRINSGTVHLPRAFHKKSECIPVVILPACVGEDIVCETWLSTLLCDVTGSVVNSKMKEGIRTKSRFFLVSLFLTLTTFWRHLWCISGRTRGTMESHELLITPSDIWL